MTPYEIFLAAIALVLIGMLVGFRISAKRQKREAMKHVRERRRSKRPISPFFEGDREAPIFRSQELGKSPSGDPSNPSDSSRHRDPRP